ncbi:hypothetical protein ACJIZ3_021746 [Penstemon smallii]|uniref:Uncharacterized protein n=1 Tax=Penstemon smallii TaxID=265156 RepID=A0ABD3SMJ6_9LAMI
MNDGVSTPQQLLRRRNSISTSTALAVLPNHNSSSSTTTTSASSSSSYSFPSDELELLSIKPASHSYTSLKDLLPSVAVNSPKPSPVHLAQPATDICIRNRLVKQAAWAYLQPKSTSPGSTGGNFFHRFWPRFTAVIDLIRANVVRILDWTLRFIRIRSSR